MATFNGQVGASSDDARENSGTMGLTASTASLGGANINLGFRFTNVTVPQGSTINSATFAVHVVSTSNDDPNGCGVLLEDADNAATFSTSSNDITNRPKTSSVTWSGTNIGSGFQNAPDIASLVQTVVNRPGWASGNALVVVLDGVSGSDLTVTMYDGTPANAATLTIVYTEPGGKAARLVLPGLLVVSAGGAGMQPVMI